MAFRIDIRTQYIEIDVFHFSRFWDQDFQDDEDREFKDRCLTVSPVDAGSIEELVEVIKEKGFAWSECLAMFPNEAVIEVDGIRIENPFSDDQKWEMPSPEFLIRQSFRSSSPGTKLSVLQKDFLYFKVWENSGGFSCEGIGDFSASNLAYEGGCFRYQDQSFDLMDGEGSSSYEVVYRDGTCVTV